MFPVGLAIMLTGYREQYLWTTTIFLGLQALILLMFILKYWGFAQALLTSMMIFILSLFIEFIGVKTGYPFGNYTYTSILIPQLFGVPLAIAFAWFSVTVSAYLITIDLFGKAGAFTAALISSVLIFSTDILLEPFASFVNGFWIWIGYRIPFVNFISWLVIGFLFSLVLTLFIKPGKSKYIEPLIKKIPYIVLLVNILTFFVINIHNNYIFMSVVGGTIITFVLLILPIISKNEA